jgi:hypothetical protein
VCGGRLGACGDERRIARPHDRHAAPLENPISSLVFEALESGKGAPKQRHVVGVLEVGHADHTGSAVGTSEPMSERMSIEAEHPRAASRQFPARGETHAAKTEDDHVDACAGFHDSTIEADPGDRRADRSAAEPAAAP